MRTIDKNVIYLGWVSFFTDMASSMVTTVLPLYLLYVLHQGVDRLGIIIALSALISYLFRFLFGYLSDRYRIVKPFVLWGYLISAFSKPLLALSSSYGGIVALRSIERMGKAIRSAPKDRLISAYVKDSADAKTFGFHKMMDIAGELSGVVLIYLFFLTINESIEGIKTIFYTTLIPGIIAVLILIFFVRDVPKRPSKKVQKRLDKRDYALFPLLFIYFSFLFFVVSDQYIIVLVKASGFSLSEVSLLMILFTLSQTLFSYYSGIISDKIGATNALLVAFVFALIAMRFLSINFWVGVMFLGLFTVMSLNTMRGFISSHARSKASVYGIFYAGIAVFSALGALFIGFLWKPLGAENILILSQIGMSIVILILLFWKRTMPAKPLKTQF